MRRLIAIMLFLVLVDEGDPTTIYSKNMFAPFAWVNGVLMAPLPIKIRVFDILMLGILIVASSKRTVKARTVGPMRSALFLAVGTVVVWFIYGIVTGGDVRAASWQVYLMLSAILASFTIAATFQSVDHFAMLGKAVLAAGLYRAAMCWLFHLAYVSTGRISPSPEYIAAHDDSVVWVICIFMLLVYALNKRRRAITLRAAFAIVFILVAIQWNQRRLAWVSMVMAGILWFFLLPHDATRKRVVSVFRLAAPLAALYVMIGWGRTEGIFKPLRAFATVSTAQDLSTLARNAENLGLIATVRTAGAIGGTGWGHGYIELTNKYSIAQFMELWPYIPHNSVLGLLAYTGILGFAGYWLAFPTAVFLNGRVAKLADDPRARGIGIVASTAMMICANQLYGDMGIFSARTMYLLATTYGIALRLPMTAGVWDLPQKKTSPRAVQAA